MKLQKINSIFTLLLISFFQNYEIVGKNNNEKLVETLYKHFKNINLLLEKDFIFYSENMTKDNAEKSIIQLDRLYKLITVPLEELFKEYTEIKQTNLHSEYQEFIVHFNNEYAMLKYACEDISNYKKYNVTEAINELKSMANV